MRTLLPPDDLIAVNEQPTTRATLFPEMDIEQHDLREGIEKRLVLEAESISNDIPDERRRKLIPWSNLIRCLEVVGTGGAIEQRLVQALDLAQTDAWRNVEAILGCGLDSAIAEHGVLPGLLNLNIDVEQTGADSDSVEESRPKGKVLKFEPPPHMKAMPPRNLIASDSTRAPAKIIEFRLPESFN